MAKLESTGLPGSNNEGAWNTVYFPELDRHSHAITPDTLRATTDETDFTDEEPTITVTLTGNPDPLSVSDAVEKLGLD